MARKKLTKKIMKEKDINVHCFSKRRVYCPTSFKSKFLFTTEKEANLYLDFIKGSEQDFHKNYIPIRSYYCPQCNGWHVSSSEKKDNVRSYRNPYFLIKDWMKDWELVEYYDKDHLLEIDIKEGEEIKRVVFFEDEFIEKLQEYNSDIIDGYIDKYSDKRFVVKFVK